MIRSSSRWSRQALDESASPRVTAARTEQQRAGAPVVTSAASTPMSVAMRSPTRSWRSFQVDEVAAASAQAATTSAA